MPLVIGVAGRQLAVGRPAGWPRPHRPGSARRGDTQRRGTRQGLIAISCLAILAIGGALGPDGARGAEADRYAYLFVQGRVVDDDGTRPAAGLIIRVSAGGEVFESVTDDRGVFMFEKLPVAAYDLQVVAPDGRVIRSIRRIEDPNRIRLRVRVGRGEASPLRLRPEMDRIEVEIPRPAPSWGRFWKEFGIVLATAGLFAL